MKSFIELQKQIAEFSKKGIKPSVDFSNANTYRKMVYDNTANALNTTYEMTKLALGDDVWMSLVDEFVRNYHSDEPRYWRMPERLITFEEKANWGAKHEVPWLSESLKFEWKLTELFHAPDDASSHRDHISIDQPAVFGTTWELMSFNYPVYKPKWTELNADKGSYSIILYRDPQTLEVKIEEINPFLSVLVTTLKENPSHSIKEILKEIMGANGLEINNAVLDSTSKFCNKLLVFGVLK